MLVENKLVAPGGNALRRSSGGTEKSDGWATPMGRMVEVTVDDDEALSQTTAEKNVDDEGQDSTSQCSGLQLDFEVTVKNDNDNDDGTAGVEIECDAETHLLATTEKISKLAKVT